MVDKDVVFEKIGQIQNGLRRIQERTQGSSESLHDIDTQDIFVLNLQRAVQSCIDLAAHIIADEGLGLPADLKENFLLLERAGLIRAAVSERLQKMVGFRNIAVHDYTAIDVTVLRAVLANNLRDLEEFYSAVLQHFHLSDPAA
ncbi:MAG: DUF86 domain-containing protein [Deltaproteobacteria bacterium]|nr:DUF86 domain-containing protein [Deltaproteobacteria bacterium]